MPLYEFHCQSCQSTFDVRATFDEKERGLAPICPQCQGTDVNQVLTTGVFIGGSGSTGSFNNAAACGPSMGPGCCG